MCSAKFLTSLLYNLMMKSHYLSQKCRQDEIPLHNKVLVPLNPVSLHLILFMLLSNFVYR